MTLFFCKTKSGHDAEVLKTGVVQRQLAGKVTTQRFYWGIVGESDPNVGGWPFKWNEEGKCLNNLPGTHWDFSLDFNTIVGEKEDEAVRMRIA